MKRIPHRTFTEEFKREAIKLVTDQGLKLSEASKRLDVTTKSLKTWMDLQAKGELKSSLGADKLSAEQRRIRELERELAIAKMERDILKIGETYTSNAFFAMRYAMIDNLRHQHPVSKLCDLLNVAKSGYQAWSTGKVTAPRKLEDLRLVTAIKAAHERGRGIYGPKKIQSELASQGLQVGLNRIKRLRRLHGIRCIHKKKFRVTTDSRHKLPIAENLLNRQFNPSRPNQIWVADITYIHTDEGWLFGETTSHSTKLANYASQVAGYLAAIKDLYSCEIVGWAMDKQMTKQLVLDALRAAYWRKKPSAGLLHHSDRGSQ